ncbi:MAG: rhodanese-like domain-containing protein [Candidatus Kapabacteria bacterium]|jgi:rhodanese-related sulfurtransferase|nr:rhodanese-like domain-containing protein [Candidatus Kapabacteria bacterium]
MVCPINISINVKLGVFALVLGIIALIIGDPAQGSNVSFDAKEISMLTENKSDAINPTDIADWLVQGRMDFILVDVSSKEAYDKLHIPGAVCMSMNTLQSAKLPRNEKIILYSDDDVKTAQAWMILKGLKYPDIYRVDGGLNAWKSSVLNPNISSTASGEEILAFEKRKVLARYFGGVPTMDGVAIVESEGGMKISKPVFEAASAAPKKKKRAKKEGC